MSVVSAENAEHYTWGSGCDGWHFVKNPNLGVIRKRVPSGCSEVRHYHEKAEQFFYVISGRATLETDGVINEIRPDSGVHVPAGVPHRLSNQGEEDLVFIVISTPHSHGDRVLSPGYSEKEE